MSTSPSSTSRRRRQRRMSPGARAGPAAGGMAMEIDVFTLFPEWFEWFACQRHVRNVLARGSRLQCVNLRDHTPLSGRQVDDTPFGGGAGMLLRVDVVESALRARYAVDPVELRERRRAIALTPCGRVLDDALARGLAAEPALTL